MGGGERRKTDRTKDEQESEAERNEEESNLLIDFGEVMTNLEQSVVFADQRIAYLKIRSCRQLLQHKLVDADQSEYIEEDQ